MGCSIESSIYAEAAADGNTDGQQIAPVVSTSIVLNSATFKGRSYWRNPQSDRLLSLVEQMMAHYDDGQGDLGKRC